MLHSLLIRIAAPLVALSLATPALADIPPEPLVPDEPTSPMLLALAAVVVVILALYVFRRLRR